MLTLVLDSNILVSAFLSPGGQAAETLQQARAHTLFVSRYILAEVWRTLHSEHIRKKYRYSDEAIDRHLNDLYSASERIEPQEKIAVCIDVDDNAVLACAAEARADYLVTRNIKHFPSVYLSVKIISPGEFLQIIRQ